jgi:hypothetical protein
MLTAALAAWGCAASPSAVAAAAVEYFHFGFGHYFLTATPEERAALDAGRPAGWARTGESFTVLGAGAAGAANVCRFWTGDTYAPVSSHFYTPLPDECAAVKAKPEWRYEGDAFAVILADAAGACPSATMPLYRLYNNSLAGVPNHRFTTRPDLRTQMLLQGWTAEGAGIGVIGCVPAATAPTLLKGLVIGPCAERARVCADGNRNGRCDPAEAQAYTDAQGAYELPLAADTSSPLVAEVIAGGAGCAATAGGDAVTYRMASPSPAYSPNVTPYSTLVHLTGYANNALGEDVACRRRMRSSSPRHPRRTRSPPRWPARS